MKLTSLIATATFATLLGCALGKAKPHTVDTEVDEEDLTCFDRANLPTVYNSLGNTTTCETLAAQTKVDFTTTACQFGSVNSTCPITCGIPCDGCSTCPVINLNLNTTLHSTDCKYNHVVNQTSCEVSCNPEYFANSTLRVCDGSGGFSSSNPLCTLNPKYKYKGYKPAATFNPKDDKVTVAYFFVSNLKRECTTPLSTTSVGPQVTDIVLETFRNFFNLKTHQVQITAKDSNHYYADILFSSPAPCALIEEYNTRDIKVKNMEGYARKTQEKDNYIQSRSSITLQECITTTTTTTTTTSSTIGTTTPEASTTTASVAPSTSSASASTSTSTSTSTSAAPSCDLGSEYGCCPDEVTECEEGCCNCIPAVVINPFNCTANATVTSTGNKGGNRFLRNLRDLDDNIQY